MFDKDSNSARSGKEENDGISGNRRSNQKKLLNHYKSITIFNAVTFEFTQSVLGFVLKACQLVSQK